MQRLCGIYFKKPLLKRSYTAFKSKARLLNTGIHHSLLENYKLFNPTLIPLYHDQEDNITTEWDLIIPKSGEFHDAVLTWKQNILLLKSHLESVDYALLISNGVHRTKLIFSAVRLNSSSEVPTPSADKLGGGISETLPSTMDEINKRLSVIKQRLPAWQESIASQLQRLQDYLNKKLNDVGDEKKSCP